VQSGSLAILTLISPLEDRFDIVIDNEDFTVGVFGAIGALSSCGDLKAAL
jgi:acyl carrier protein